MPGLLGSNDDEDEGRGLLGVSPQRPADSLLGQLDQLNSLALGPLYVPRDPNPLAAGAGPAGPRFNLEQVHPRTLKPLSNESDMTQPGSHTFSINNPAGDRLGLIDTEWSPDTGGLHIADFQSNEGTNSLGLSAVRQIRDLLLARYPDVKTLTGQRITGAASADRMSGVGPGRAATQTIGGQ